VLLDNALNHGAGEVRIDVDVAADSVTISVADEGHGFTDSPLATSTNQAAANSDDVHGLGLPLAQRLVEAMPGRLTIAHSGTNPRVDIVLQRQQPATSPDVST
jgi:signal transduction histidine kinase